MKKYPGIIEEIFLDGATVNCLQPYLSNTSYKMPIKKDVLKYQYEDIICRINIPEPNQRGIYNLHSLSHYFI